MIRKKLQTIKDLPSEGPGGIRTPSHLLTREFLFQVELQGHLVGTVGFEPTA